MPHSLQISRFGGPETLVWKETASQALPSDGVRIQVQASGVNFADVMMRMGLYPEAPKPPFAPGYEISGKVIEIGSSVTQFRIGDRVLAGMRFGGYTDEAVLPAFQVRKIPKNLSYAEAAAIPVNFMTAWVALQDMARVRKGDRVLIQSAAGGVGVAAVQIAAEAGATVIGLVGSMDKADVVRSLGASEVMTYDSWNSLSDKDAGGLQTILDSQGGRGLKRNFARLAPGGRIVNFGVSDMVSGKKRSLGRILSVFSQTAFFTPFQLMMKNKGIFGLNMLQLFNTPQETEALGHPNLMISSLDQVLARFETQKYRVIVGKTFSILEGGEAHNYLQSHANVGKVVLTNPNGESFA